MRLLSWARGRGITTYRAPERVERLYSADRSDQIWSEADVARFNEVAPATMQRALALALETGQRQGDLLILPWRPTTGLGYASASRRAAGRWPSPSPSA